jgi:hypothetical protein
MEEYVVPAAQIAENLAQAAEEHTIAAQQATERANEYVLFATVLFFASISAKLSGRNNRWAILSVAIIGLMAGGVVLLAFPTA